MEEKGKRCRFCGERIFAESEHCPNCGENPHKTPWVGILVGIAISIGTNVRHIIYWNIEHFVALVVVIGCYIASLLYLKDHYKGRSMFGFMFLLSGLLFVAIRAINILW